MMKPFKKERFPERVLLDLAKGCNLKCPMCPRAFGPDQLINEKADFDKIKAALQGVLETHPLIQLSLYTEPTLILNFREVVSAIKEMGFCIALNTNGILLNESLSRFLIDVGMDSISISLDAFEPKTYEKTRGVDKLEHIKKNIMTLLKLRGSKNTPRIGVSFVRQDENINEEDAFIKYWSKHVDMVRSNSLVFDGEHDRFVMRELPKKRIPCKMLYETMPIASNGDVPICCRDAFCSAKMGNVFADSIENVWNGPAFENARKLHENGEWDKIPVCANCDGWAQFSYEKEETDELLISKSPLAAYYNVKKKLGTWTKDLADAGKPHEHKPT